MPSRPLAGPVQTHFLTTLLLRSCLMPMRFGLLGMWHPHAEGMLRRLAEHPDEFSLVAAYDGDPAVAARRRQTLDALLPGGLPLRDSADAVLRAGIDAVIVEGRVFENVAFAQRAVEAGFPVLLEKPGGIDLAGFQRLHEAAARRRLHVQMSYLFRYMSAVEELLARARSGEIGRLYAFRGRLPKPLDEYDSLVRDLGMYAGGAFFEMAGHLVDFLVALLGPPRRIATLLAHHHESLGTFVDNGVATFECAAGLGIVEVPALEVAPASRRIEVYGTEGALVIPHLGSGHLANNPTQTLEIARRGSAAWERIEMPAALVQIRDLREFCAVIGGQKAPDYSPAHDLAVHEALLQASGMAEPVGKG